ncbi:MAG: excisionase family DNA-binding protein [Rhodoferax sp.]|nr:excisionase family DNA-binding protein [Rhodoferax sp.]
MRNISANQDVMTTREVGDVLGIAVRTVQLWVEAGILPAWRTAGGHRRIARSAVERLWAERQQELAPFIKSRSSCKTRIKQTPIKLLLVEDDAFVQRVFSGIVATWCFPVALTTAVNGFEGLMRIGESRPDIVVTDVLLPGMDGFQMIRALKQPGSGFGSFKLLVVSALCSEEIADRGGLPADVVCFHKPVNFAKLELHIQKYHVERIVKAKAV